MVPERSYGGIRRRELEPAVARFVFEFRRPGPYSRIIVRDRKEIHQVTPLLVDT